MGKKAKKTRWRRLPIGGTDVEGGLSLESAPPSTDPHHRITFNEDEYTKITTPRQDVLFKKGYFGRKRTGPVSDSQETHSNAESVESECYAGEDAQYMYPTGYLDPSGVYYVNGNTFETYDPYTGTVTVVVGPPTQYPPGPPMLAALPCQPVPLQPVEWFNPPAPWCYSYNRRKRYSTDSQNCSAQSSESTGPPGSPQEPVDEACVSSAVYSPQYVYPGYMFGPPVYTMNGMTVQGMIPQPVPVAATDNSMSKRRKKRRRRRRGGVTDDGSESSCCEEVDVPSCQSGESSDVVCQSGASSDAGSKGNSDSGIHTDPTPSPPPPLHDEYMVHIQDCRMFPVQVQDCRLLPTTQEFVQMHLPTTQEFVITQDCRILPTTQEFIQRQDCRHQLPTTEQFDQSQDCHQLPLTQEFIQRQDGRQLPTTQELIQRQDCHQLTTQEFDHRQDCHQLLMTQEFIQRQDGRQLPITLELIQRQDCHQLTTTQELDHRQDRHQLTTTQELDHRQDCHQLTTTQELDHRQDCHQFTTTQEFDHRLDCHELLMTQELVQRQDCHQFPITQECLQRQDCQMLPTTQEMIQVQECSTPPSNQVVLPSLTPEEDPSECTIQSEDTSQSEVTTPEEVSEDFPTAEDDVTPNLCTTAPEFSSQESTLSATRELLLNDDDVSIVDTSPEEVYESCQSMQEEIKAQYKEENSEVPSADDSNCQLVPSTHNESLLLDDMTNDLNALSEEKSNGRVVKKDKEDLLDLCNESATEINSHIPPAIKEPEYAQCLEEVVKDTASLQVEADVQEEVELAEEVKEDVQGKVAETEYKVREEVFEQVCYATEANTYLGSSRFPMGEESEAPVPPPRRKRSMSKAAEKLAIKIVEDAIREGVQEASHTRLASPPLSITEAVTKWLYSQGSSPLTCPAPDTDSAEEGEEEEEIRTGPKNVRGNPFLASSHSGAGQRVANGSEEWDFADMCDPARSVDKYYRLSADTDEAVGEHKAPSVYKTAMHIRHNGPFPCGVCCIIQ